MIKIFNKEKPIAAFTTKSGEIIKFYEPAIWQLQGLLKLVNDLSREDTFLTFDGRNISLKEEKTWLKNTIEDVRKGKSFIIMAIDGDKVVGSCSIHHDDSRSWHVGKMGLMVAKEYRHDGIGRFMMEYVLRKAKSMKISIARLSVFSENDIAISLYKKLGFKEWGKLPKGYFRKGKYSDRVDMYKEI